MRVLRPPAVYAKTGFSKSTIRRLELAGEFPRRVRISANAIGWIEAEIDRWIEARAAEREPQAADVNRLQPTEHELGAGSSP